MIRDVTRRDKHTSKTYVERELELNGRGCCVH